MWKWEPRVVKSPAQDPRDAPPVYFVLGPVQFFCPWGKGRPA